VEGQFRGRDTHTRETKLFFISAKERESDGNEEASRRPTHTHSAGCRM